MFEYLQEIDEKIYDRYLTVEKDINGASNSFYDSYLDLQENFLKAVVERNGIALAPHISCGELLKRPEVKELFLNKYGVDWYAFDKMGDYTKKSNEHKHRKGKHIEVDTVVKYMSIFYSVSVKCVENKAGVPPFDEKYFRDLFGKMSKMDERLSAMEEISQQHREMQQQVLQAISELKSEMKEKGAQEITGSKEKSAPAGNGGADSTQILRNFISKAEKKYNWFGTKEDFKKSKIILIAVQLSLILAGVISTIFTSVSVGMYSTFTLFENIVLVEVAILLSYTLKAQKCYPDKLLAKTTSDIFVLDGDGIWRDSHKEKKIFKWARRISYVAVICNIICIWAMGSGAVRIAATVFELVFLGLTIASVFVRINLYCMYTTIFIHGCHNSGTLVYDGAQKRFFTYEEYEKRFSMFI